MSARKDDPWDLPMFAAVGYRAGEYAVMRREYRKTTQGWQWTGAYTEIVATFPLMGDAINYATRRNVEDAP